MENGKVELGGWQRSNWSLSPHEAICKCGFWEAAEGWRGQRTFQGPWHLYRSEGAELDLSEGAGTPPSLFLSVPAWYPRKKSGVAIDPSSRDSVNLGKELELLSRHSLVWKMGLVFHALRISKVFGADQRDTTCENALQNLRRLQKYPTWHRRRIPEPGFISRSVWGFKNYIFPNHKG